METQMSQPATYMSKLESQGKLPSQTKVNPIPNVTAVTLRSGKELQKNLHRVSLWQDLRRNTKIEAEVDDKTNEKNPNTNQLAQFVISHSIP